MLVGASKGLSLSSFQFQSRRNWLAYFPSCACKAFDSDYEFSCATILSSPLRMPSSLLDHIRPKGNRTQISGLSLWFGSTLARSSLPQSLIWWVMFTPWAPTYQKHLKSVSYQSLKALRLYLLEEGWEDDVSFADIRPTVFLGTKQEVWKLFLCWYWH